jgi:hypothetical protein
MKYNTSWGIIVALDVPQLMVYENHCRSVSENGKREECGNLIFLC